MISVPEGCGILRTRSGRADQVRERGRLLPTAPRLVSVRVKEAKSRRWLAVPRDPALLKLPHGDMFPRRRAGLAANREQTQP